MDGICDSDCTPLQSYFVYLEQAQELFSIFETISNEYGGWSASNNTLLKDWRIETVLVKEIFLIQKNV